MGYGNIKKDNFYQENPQ